MSQWKQNGSIYHMLMMVHVYLKMQSLDSVEKNFISKGNGDAKDLHQNHVWKSMGSHKFLVHGMKEKYHTVIVYI